MIASQPPDPSQDNASHMERKDDPIDDLQFEPEEFSEEDVLPFLLQAQDIIAKLESRVVDLETDLSVRVLDAYRKQACLYIIHFRRSIESMNMIDTTGWLDYHKKINTSIIFPTSYNDSSLMEKKLSCS